MSEPSNLGGGFMGGSQNVALGYTNRSASAGALRGDSPFPHDAQAKPDGWAGRCEPGCRSSETRQWGPWVADAPGLSHLALNSLRHLQSAALLLMREAHLFPIRV